MAPSHRVVEHPGGGHGAGRRLGSGQCHRGAGASGRPEGLALGVDISEPMLARAVRNEAGPQVGFIRADAQRLPLRDNTVDAVVSIAVLQLVPGPAAVLAEVARVLRPGGRLAILVPSAGRVTQLLPKVGGAYSVSMMMSIGDALEKNGFVGVRVKNFTTYQWVRGTNG